MAVAKEKGDKQTYVFSMTKILGLGLPMMQCTFNNLNSYCLWPAYK